MPIQIQSTRKKTALLKADLLQVEALANQSSGFTYACIAKRRDMRGITTFTIDPVERALVKEAHKNNRGRY